MLYYTCIFIPIILIRLWASQNRPSLLLMFLCEVLSITAGSIDTQRVWRMKMCHQILNFISELKEGRKIWARVIKKRCCQFWYNFVSNQFGGLTWKISLTKTDSQQNQFYDPKESDQHKYNFDQLLCWRKPDLVEANPATIILRESHYIGRRAMILTSILVYFKVVSQSANESPESGEYKAHPHKRGIQIDHATVGLEGSSKYNKGMVVLTWNWNKHSCKEWCRGQEKTLGGFYYPEFNYRNHHT